MRRQLRPGIEGMEARELLTVLPFLFTSQPRQVSPNTILGLISAEQLTPPSNASGTASALTGQTPTPREQAREKFRAVFAGPFSNTPGRFTDQARQTFIRGTGFSSVFAHGDVQLLIITPTDPTAPLLGVAVILDRNNNNSALLSVDISGSQADFDRLGRPVHLTWSVSPFAGAGSFTSGPFSLAYGQGTVEIAYGPPKFGKHPDSLGKQVATVVFKGSLFTPGGFNPLTNAGLEQSHKRLL